MAEKNTVKVYSTPTCPWCIVAKNFLKEHGITFEEVDVSKSQEAAEEMIEKENARDDAYLLLQVHDELVYEIRTERANELGVKIKKIMESVLTAKETHGVPIIATMKSGTNWGTMHPI